jgi:hypothetical protein
VVEPRDEPRRLAAVGARLDAERALTDGGQHLRDGNRRADAVRQIEPPQTSRRQNQRVVPSRVQFSEARVHVPAHVF